MRRLMIKNVTRSFFFLTFVATFLLSFHHYFISFINSSYLSKYVTDKNVGILYTVGAIFTLIIFLNMARMLKRYGNYKVMLFFLGAQALSLMGLAFFKNVSLLAISFLIQSAIYPMLIVSLDIFLEHYTRKENTGTIRGTFLTIFNLAAILSPVLVGLVIAYSNYRSVYLISLIFILILFVLIQQNFMNFRDTPYVNTKGIVVLTKLLRNKNVRDVYVTAFMLQIFYAWITVYVPIYFLQYLHFSWPFIGLILSVSLIPFVLFEIPLGELADKKIGEKEILITGFIIMIGCVLVMAQPSLSTIASWMIVLTVAGIGTSFVEVAGETYFYKQIEGTDDDLAGYWRMSHPIGYILGALAGSVSLIILPSFSNIFYVLAFLLVIGLIYATKIKDTL